MATLSFAKRVLVPFARVNRLVSLSKSCRRNIMTSNSFRYAEAVEELKSNPYFDKYAKKIAALQRTSPEEFLSRLESSVTSRRSPSSSSSDDQRAGPNPPEAGKVGVAKPKANAFTKPKLLNDVLKMELVEDKDADEIRAIWLEYHKSKDVISAIIPVKNFETILSRSEAYPLFLLPLPRKHGYEFIVCQFSGNEVHFTPLISYQAHQENAPECLTMVYYPDLKESKRIVLMKGEYDRNVIDAVEAQCLANQLQLYYGEDNEKRTKMLERFTHHPDSFKHMDLIAEMECLTF